MVRRVGLVATLVCSACFEDVDPPAVEDDGDTDASSGDEGPAVCGDGVVGAEELCDDANEIDGDGCTQCQWSGTVVWSKIEGTQGSTVAESATDVAVDEEGRAFVTGIVAGGNSADIWVRAFDGEDGTAVWTATEHKGEDFGGSVVVDGQGGAYVAGVLGGGDLGAVNPWVAHFDANGGSVFETTVQDAMMRWGAAVGIAASGDVLLTNGFRLSGLATDAVVQEFARNGVATGREFVADAGLADFGWRIAAEGSLVRATAFLSTSAVVGGWNDGFGGDPTWVTAIPGAVQSNAFAVMDGLQPLSLAMAEDGATFACVTVANGENVNMQLSRLDSSGQVQWSQQHDAGASDVCGGIAVDGAGDVVIVGTSSAVEGASVIAVAKYTASADLVWEATIESEGGLANGVEVAIGPDGGVFVVGAVGTATDSDIYVARLVP